MKKIIVILILSIFAGGFFTDVFASDVALPAEDAGGENAAETQDDTPPSRVARPLRKKIQLAKDSLPRDQKLREEERATRGFSEIRPTINGFDHQLTQHWIARYSTKAHLRWLESVMRNGEPYLDFIRAEVERRNLPPELVFLPVIESGFTVTARSRSGATGLWQFMRNSMKPYLKLDDWRDERFDFWASTNAALSKLESNYKEFGSWPLALAAYNSGGGAISRVVKATGSRDYWSLAENKKLKTESIHYVPKLLAVYYIISNPRKFGLDICRPQEYFEWTKVAVPKQVNITLLAEYSGLETHKLRDANRELSTLVTPPSEYFIKVRTENANAVRSALENEDIKLLKHHIYTIKSGDTLYSLSLRYGVSVEQILNENTGLKANALRLGTRIAIPAFKDVAASAGASVDASTEATSDKGATGEPKTGQWLGAYTIKKGDTLWSIARRFGISAAALARVNGITQNSTLGIGKKLIVP